MNFYTTHDQCKKNQVHWVEIRDDLGRLIDRKVIFYKGRAITDTHENPICVGSVRKHGRKLGGDIAI